MATKAQTVRLARRAFAAVAPLEGMTRAYGEALAGEKRHRRGGFAKYHPGAASAPACAELFVARWLAEYALHPDTVPTLADMLRTRLDVVLCAAIAQRDGALILQRLGNEGLDPEAVAALSYTTAVGSA